MNLEPVFAVAILISYVLLGHLLEKWKKSSTLAQLTFHESVPAVIMGCLVGLTARSTQSSLDGDAFFEFVLPFIILQQGYALKKKNFFKYLYYIILFGILGTLVTFTSVSGVAYFASRLPGKFLLVKDDGVALNFTPSQCMKLAAVLSAADEVATMGLIPEQRHPKLAAILFGEGVVNDAVSILLFRAVSGADDHAGDSGNDDIEREVDAGAFSIELFSGVVFYFCALLGAAIGIGFGIGLFVSAILRYIPSMESEPVRQSSVILLGGYLSFSLSEALGASGILAVFFCGIAMSHYGWHSLSDGAKTSTQVTFGTLSGVSEAYCFAAMGLSLHNIPMLLSTLPIATMLFAGLMLARFVCVYGLVGLHVSPCFSQSAKGSRPSDVDRIQLDGEPSTAPGLVSLASYSSTGSGGSHGAMENGVPHESTGTNGALDSPSRPRSRRLLPLPPPPPAEGSITYPEKRVIWSSGLVRGAVAFAQVQMVEDEHAELMESITMTIVLFTTIFFGIVMPFIVQSVVDDGPSRAVSGAAQPMPPLGADGRDGDATFKDAIARGGLAPLPMDRRESQPVLDKDARVIGYGSLYQFWASFDDTYMKPTFGGRTRRSKEAMPLLQTPAYRPLNFGGEAGGPPQRPEWWDKSGPRGGGSAQPQPQSRSDTANQRYGSTSLGHEGKADGTRGDAAEKFL